MNTDQNKQNNKKTPKTYTDYSIFPGKIRLVTEDGQKVIERDVAIDMAKAQDMNLVQIAYNKNDFPHSVCKIMDYGKYLYNLQKKEKESRRKSREANAEAKEVQFSIRIDSGDLQTKINKIRKFIAEDKEKVKILVRLTRREMNLLGMAKDEMRNILTQLDDIAEMDTNPSFASGILACTVKPKK